jgi:hypothetical protein
MTNLVEQSRDPLDFLEYTGREGAARIEITSLRQQLAECQEELKQANDSLTIVYMSGFRDGSKRNLK